MHSFILILFLIFSALFQSGCSHLADSRNNRMRPLIAEHRYPNGLRLYVVEDQKFPSIAYHQWLLAGSGDENPSKRGVAHFLEHMMFRQSGNYSPLFFDQYLALHGAESNANTSYDRTIYYQQIPRSIFSQVVLLEFDRWSNLLLDSDNIEIERKIIANEFRERIDSSPSSALHTHLMKQTAGDWRYANPVMGDLTSLSSISAQDLTAFYRSFYRPENMVIVLVGDISLEEARRSLDHSFGQWHPKKVERLKLGPWAKSSDHSSIQVDKKVELGSLYLPGASLVSQDGPLYDFLAFVLSYGLSNQSPQNAELQVQHFSLLRQGRFIATIRSDRAIFNDNLKELARQQLKAKCSLIDQDVLLRSTQQFNYYFLRSLQKKSVLADEIAQGALYFDDPQRYFTPFHNNYSVDDLQQLCYSLLQAKARWEAI